MWFVVWSQLKPCRLQALHILVGICQVVVSTLLDCPCVTNTCHSTAQLADGVAASGIHPPTCPVLDQLKGSPQQTLQNPLGGTHCMDTHGMAAGYDRTCSQQARRDKSWRHALGNAVQCCGVQGQYIHDHNTVLPLLLSNQHDDF